MTHPLETCPTCGSPVEVVTGGEGTSYYVPEVERLSTALGLLAGGARWATVDAMRVYAGAVLKAGER